MDLNGITKRKRRQKKLTKGILFLVSSQKKKILWVLVGLTFLIIFILWLLSFSPKKEGSTNEASLPQVLGIEELKQKIKQTTNQNKIKEWNQLSPEQRKIIENLEKKTFPQFEQENK
jgi:hypothetical protein